MQSSGFDLDELESRVKEEHGTGALPASDFPPSSDGADARRRERVTWSLLFFIGLSLLALAVVAIGLSTTGCRS
jgi:hypothetical protein